ncbi:hypothetical protein CFY87_00275 [Actinobacillus seminis]|uniref:Uncharacterized protein n=1 Tax=Actinobacillus seminis TaxID=722 RepID=A0A263HGI4_9PAST|nr:hypothetical protein [Actinobacillus seminis]OZN25696.1 hypothetical protein CFY87_00275 [Actinobacillus seminis]SUU37008.1 Uncharacterised protein [Actinobacillus seminis]
MTFSEKIGYNLGSVINKFKHWQASKWLKAVIILGIFSLFFGLFYVIYHLFALIFCFALWVAFQYLPKENSNKYEFDYSLDEGYRVGHSGYGYYDSNDIKLHD